MESGSQACLLGGSEDSPESIWALVAFLRQLPKLTPEELKQMEKLAGADQEPDQSTEVHQEKIGKGRYALPKSHSHSRGTKRHQH